MVRRRPRNNLRSGYVFNCEFTEKRALKYLINLINSKILFYKPVELFRFTEDLIGEKSIVQLLRKAYPEVLADEDSKEWTRYNCLHDYTPIDIQMKFLREEISNLLSEKIKSLVTDKESDTEKRIKSLAKTFNLTYEETEIISFFYIIDSSEILKEHLGRYDIVEFNRVQNLKSHGDTLLGLKRGPFLNAIRDGNLFKSQILEKAHDTINITPWCSDYISGIRGTELTHEFFTKENNETLSVHDFDVSKDELNVIDVLIKSKGPMNLLIYGSKGTGKSSFARSLAKKYKKELLTVKIPEDDNHKDKLRAIHATVNLADRKSLVLVDEADEILNTYESLFFKSKVNKSWINNFLDDSHKKKIIWITNRISEIDSSTMRRFSFSLQFQKFDSKKRLKVIKYELNKIGMQDYFTEDDLSSLCKNYNVDAAGIVNAVNALKVSKRMKKETALRNIRTVLRNHEKITCGKQANEHAKDLSDYSLEGLNTSCDLKNIISVMERFTHSKEERRFTNLKSITVLLHGVPGSGKSCFVYHLGHLLGKEVLLKRCSDIQSKWVGETETNIANAFHEAQENESILFFDEADSFLYPRKDANHSWQKTATNELLTQIENFKGIAIFATNDIEGLDFGSLRRFKVKIHFKPLAPEGNLNFYMKLLNPFVSKGENLSEMQIEQIKSIRNLTPGDFSIIKDNTIFQEAPEITHQMLIESLINEVSYKNCTEKLIGFSK